MVFQKETNLLQICLFFACKHLGADPFPIIVSYGNRMLSISNEIDNVRFMVKILKLVHLIIYIKSMLTRSIETTNKYLRGITLLGMSYLSAKIKIKKIS